MSSDTDADTTQPEYQFEPQRINRNNPLLTRIFRAIGLVPPSQRDD